MTNVMNYVGELNEKSQRQRFQYEFKITNREGPSHQPAFTVALHVRGAPVSTGEGSSLKAAKQEAAKAYLYPQMAKKGIEDTALNRLTEAEQAKVRQTLAWLQTLPANDSARKAAKTFASRNGDPRNLRFTFLEQEEYITVQREDGRDIQYYDITLVPRITNLGWALLHELEKENLDSATTR